MHKALLTVMLSGFSAVVSAAVHVPAASAAPGSAALFDYIVVLDEAVDVMMVADEHARADTAEIRKLYGNALNGYAARMTAERAAEVAADARVLWVQPDGLVTISAQTVPTGVDRVDAESSPTARIDGVDERVDVDVAVLDTGVDLDHPDLNVHAAGAKNCSTGYTADDGHGHGTHVAGTVGALDDAGGVVGVAPGARIWPVRVLDDGGSGAFSDVICGIDFVTAHADEIEVANLSLGGLGSDDGNCGTTDHDAMHRAICASVAAGVTYVVAAGNSRTDAASFIPAAYDEVITVSALADFNGVPGGGALPSCLILDLDDTSADFSNYGPDIDLIAPGVCIRSTWKQDGYATLSGTSMASPHVAGGAALYRTAHPGASPAQVRTALQDAGTLDWIWPAGDLDGVQEKLLNVAAF